MEKQLPTSEIISLKQREEMKDSQPFVHFQKLLTSQILNFEPKIEVSHLNIETLKEYRLQKNFLKLKGLSSYNRILRDWIYLFCYLKELKKQTAVLTCNLIDLSFQMGINVNIEEAQIFGIACLFISIKFHECMDRKFHFEELVLDFKQLNFYENKILFQLKFKINPITYCDIGDQILQLWKAFQKFIMNFYETQKVHENSFIFAFFVFRKCYDAFSQHLFFELLQFAFHFLDTFDFNFDQFVFNAFYFILCTQVYSISGKVTKDHFESYYSNQTELAQIVEGFTKFCHRHEYTLSLQYDKKMMDCLCLMYNSLVEDFNPKAFKLDIYSPDHQMWIGQQLSNKLTYYFDAKLKSFKSIREELSYLIDSEKVKMEIVPSPSSTTEQNI